MTVKTRITMLIAGAGFIASLLFSVVVFFELREQPFELLDSVLQEEGDRATAKAIKNGEEGAVPDSAADKMHPYWIRIYEQGSNKMLYQSDLAKAVQLPFIKVGAGAVVKADVPDSRQKVEQGSGRQVTFRVKTFSVNFADRTYTTQIARPMEKLEEELREMVLGIIAGLIFSTLILIAISRFVADRILKPVGEMKNLALAISEKNLDRRLPVENGRDEFSELAETINLMLDRLQYSFARQRDFLFDTSHELKTPLATMRLAIDEICAADGDKSEENLSRLKNQVLRVEKLVKDLLNLSALETLTGINSQNFDLTELLSSLFAEYQFLSDAQSISMDIRLPERLRVSGDPEKLRRAFSNIIDNALKYNLEGGRIEADGAPSADGVTITIGNTGAGVSEAELPRVFDQFYRIEKSRSAQFGGSGLGLTIAKRIVELHGGWIKMESRPEDWTRVTIFLPNAGENQPRS